MSTGYDGIKSEDNRFWSACGATCRHHNCITRFHEGAGNVCLIVKSCHLRGFDCLHHHGSGWRRHSLIEREDGISFVPSATNTVDHLRSAWHIEADQFVHPFRLWEVRHLTNE
jgi:hypothetical protein